MGTTIANAANDYQCLVPSDSAEMTAQQVAHFTASGQPAAVKTLWTGATFSSLNVPVGQPYDDYVLQGGAIVKKDTLYNLENMKSAVRKVHDRLNVLHSILNEESAYHYKDEIDIGSAILASAHRGIYVVIRRLVPSVASLTFEQRIRFCNLMAEGPTELQAVNDDQSVIRYFLYFEQRKAANNPVTTPTHPVVWVDPRTSPPETVGIGNIFELSNTEGFTKADSTVVSGLNLGAHTDFRQVNHLANWIDGLTE